jgi:hypothetical protein
LNEAPLNKTKLFQLAKSSAYTPLQLVGQSGGLIDDNRNDVSYFIKFLSDSEYNAESARIDYEEKKRNNFENCKIKNAGMGLSSASLNNKCSLESGYLQ